MVCKIKKSLNSSPALLLKREGSKTGSFYLSLQERDLR